MGRGLATAAGLIALAAAVGGCGGGGGDSSEALAKAATTTGAVSGARTSFRATISNPGLPTPLELRGAGVVIPRTHAARMTFQAVSGPQLPGTGLRQLGGEVVMSNLTMYLRLGLLEQQLPRGKRWLKLDFRRAGRAQGINVAQFLQGGQDPSQALGYLRATSGRTRKLGQERVRGVSTTRYRATVDLHKFPRTLPQSERRSARQSVDRVIRLTGTAKFPTDVWIDSRGLVRRQQSTLSAPGPNGSRQRIVQRLEFYDFGAHVRVQAPPGSQVLDATKLAGSGQQSLR
ncbi:MAG: hypothetical protein ABR581_09500 [Thermoleophilaceae bacterium]